MQLRSPALGELECVGEQVLENLIEVRISWDLLVKNCDWYCDS
jgi:hypothetical protein